MDQDITKSSVAFNKSKLKKMVTCIFEDQDMTSEYVVQPQQTKQELYSQKIPVKIIEQSPQNRQSIEKEQFKSNISRLQIEIQKHKFTMELIIGQVFFMVTDAYLEGSKNRLSGKIMITNYRILFFNEGKKRVDIPFGFIAKVQYIDKLLRLIYSLRYPHSWTFTIANYSKYNQFKNVGNIYYKSNEIKKMFAFQYALKLMPFPQPYQFHLEHQYKKFKFDNNFKAISLVKQPKYSLCSTYPSQFYTINQIDLKNIMGHRKNHRFPILAYQYVNPQSKVQVPLWISSSYQDVKCINKCVEKQFLGMLKCGLKLEIFAAETKNSKLIDEHQFDKHLSVHYLKLESNQELSIAEKSLFQVFLANKKPFIKQVLNSKWYNYIANILHACQFIRNLYLQQSSILIRCDSGCDKSLLLASLIQIVIEPYYRTFKGFQSLVMRMFIHNGHPFAQRLGLRELGSITCPIFLQFLDCVSQLINQNPSHFEFNFKYLAKISNFMQVNMYGTFLANSSKQYKQNLIEVETCSIWPDLITPITTNGFYDKKGGILQIGSTLSSIRLWKEHFGDMISPSKDHYGLQQIAQDNDDYLNLYCLRLKQQNVELMASMKEKVALIQKLQKQLKEQQCFVSI